MTEQKKKRLIGATRLRKNLRELREMRRLKAEYDDSQKALGEELCKMMLEADPEDVGVVFAPKSEPGLAAYRQQNDASVSWDVEAIVEWAKENDVWDGISTRMFDKQKWEAEVAAGNIPKKVVRQFTLVGEKPKPFIRFGNRQDNSIDKFS